MTVSWAAVLQRGIDLTALAAYVVTAVVLLAMALRSQGFSSTPVYVVNAKLERAAITLFSDFQLDTSDLGLCASGSGDASRVDPCGADASKRVTKVSVPSGGRLSLEEPSQVGTTLRLSGASDARIFVALQGHETLVLHTLTIQIPLAHEMAPAGSIILTVDAIDPAFGGPSTDRFTPFMDVGADGLIETGTVTLLDRQFSARADAQTTVKLADENLQPGDHIAFLTSGARPATGTGIFAINSKRGLEIAFRVEAERAVISRYGASGYEVVSTWLERAIADPWITLMGAFLAFVAGAQLAASKALKALGWSLEDV